jgi:hypothetical protein
LARKNEEWEKLPSLDINFLNDFCGFLKTAVFSENINFELNMEGPRSSKNMVIIFSKQEMFKILLDITILAFILYILAPTVLPFLEALLAALFWYDPSACCHILLNFSYRPKTMAYKTWYRQWGMVGIGVFTNSFCTARGALKAIVS